ncbi:7422_t:CDS:1, partial [Racocetra persica]
VTDQTTVEVTNQVKVKNPLIFEREAYSKHITPCILILRKGVP